jgi:glyoxylase-like metal-dependent hydrolase (beta-lactamase superfamily II)
MIDRLALSLLLGLFSAGGQTPVFDTQGRSSPPPIQTVGLAKDIYMVRGEWGANAGFFVGREGVLVIDGKATERATRKVVAEIARITPKPITHVAFTHGDPDCFNGRGAYPKDAAVISSLRTLTEWSYEKAMYAGLPVYLESDAPASIYASWPASDFSPSLAFDGQLNLRLGATPVEFLRLGPAHTSGDTAVCFPDRGVAFIGDLAFPNRDPLIQDYKGGRSYGLVRALSLLLGKKPELRIFVPSHADPIGRQELDLVLKSVERTYERVLAMVDAGKTLDEVKRAFAVPDAPKEDGKWVWPSLAVTIYRELNWGKTAETDSKAKR